MKLTTLCFCLKEDQVLLGKKKSGFGKGKWNGYGGKIEEGESLKDAAIRELEEESRLLASKESLEQVGLARFYVDEDQLFECHVFLIKTWQGKPGRTEEITKHRWFSISQLPLKEMLAGDRKWVPLILDGKKLEFEVNSNADGSKVKNFSYRERQFA